METRGSPKSSGRKDTSDKTNRSSTNGAHKADRRGETDVKWTNAERSSVPHFLASRHTQQTAVVKNYFITDFGVNLLFVMVLDKQTGRNMER